MAPPGQSSSQPLPSKELALFKKIIKCYEHKQYKIGLRCAKTILSNPQFSEHGETLAMRGLILNCMGRQAEAQDCVKKGLRNDLKSYVCWHVYGLVQRSDKKYDEAIKAYKRALMLDPENLQILRDLSLLQIQMRDYEGYRDSRYTLLKLRPTQRVSWIGYATAYHLLEDYEKALSIVTETLNNFDSPEYVFEHSELVLYQNMILRESGQLEEALRKLEENSTHIVDKLAYMETRADLLMSLGRLDQAQWIYDKLVERNPENTFYYDRLEKCQGLEENDIVGRTEFYVEQEQLRPRAAAPKRIPLTFVEGDELRQRLIVYLRAGLRKGIPSLFKNLLPLYEHPEKVAIIEHILTDFVRRLEAEGYQNGSLETGEEAETTCESPTTVLWLYYLVAQHYDRIGKYEVALRHIDNALTHTPTLIELLMVKAKIYKHAGDAREAARLMEEAQSLDTADRYVNSKCAKYLLRAGLYEAADAMCAKFTREGQSASANLHEMQCMWYEIECAKAFRMTGRWGESLKKCHEIERHFLGIVEDQFDFHTYCLRKMTLCAYIRLLRLEDILRQHPFYYRAAKIAIKIYLRMYDRPDDLKEKDAATQGNLSASELKKLKRKANKEKAQREAAEAAAKAKNPNKGKGETKEGDEVANGEPAIDPQQLLATATPIDEAAKFVAPLLQLGSTKPGAYLLGFDVYLRKEKPLLMLQCLKKARDLAPNHPLLHVANIQYLQYYAKAQLTGLTESLVKELTDELFPLKDVDTLNETFKSKNIASFPHRMAVARVNLLLKNSAAASTKNWLLKSLEDESLKDLNLKFARKFYDGIAYGWFGDWTKEELEQLVRRCHQLFHGATLFGGGVAPSPTIPKPEDTPDDF